MILANSKVVFKGKFLRVISKSGWEYAERTNASGAVCILAVTDDDELLLVEQYRIPVGNKTIELPAGLIGDEDADADQSPEDSARRELVEEAGYEAKFMTKLVEVSSSPGMISERTILFKAAGLTKVSEGGVVKEESIKVHKVRIESLSRWLKMKQGEGYLLDAKVYSCLFFL